MKLNFRNFLRDDAGAITIDWVALTAGILLMGIMVVYAIFNGGVGGLTENISATLAGIVTDVDTGASPDLNGSVVADTGMTLPDGTVLPIGTTIEVINPSTLLITTPDGRSTTQVTEGGEAIVPTGTILTVTSSSTLTTNTGEVIHIDANGNAA